MGRTLMRMSSVFVFVILTCCYSQKSCRPLKHRINHAGQGTELAPVWQPHQEPKQENEIQVTSTSISKGENTLQKLPTEILVRIGNNLSVTEAAALEACSQAVWERLGGEFLGILANPTPAELRSRCLEIYSFNKENDKQKDQGYESFWGAYNSRRPKIRSRPEEKDFETFMLLLEKDTKNSIYCHYCMCVHRP